MWFSLSTWTWIKVAVTITLYAVVIAATLIAAVYSFRFKQQEDQEYQKLQECCDRCKMTAEIKKCKRLQVDYYALSDAFRSGGWGRPQAQALWDASGCVKVLAEWDKHDPYSSK